MRIYISGQISGLPLHDARLNFAEAEKWLKGQGYEVVNPMVCNVYEEWKTWADYIIESINALRGCDGIYFIDNWVNSNGAKIEKIVSEHLRLKVIEHEVSGDFKKKALGSGLPESEIDKMIISVFETSHNLKLKNDELRGVFRAMEQMVK